MGFNSAFKGLNDIKTIWNFGLCSIWLIKGDKNNMRFLIHFLDQLKYMKIVRDLGVYVILTIKRQKKNDIFFVHTFDQLKDL